MDLHCCHLNLTNIISSLDYYNSLLTGLSTSSCSPIHSLPRSLSSFKNVNQITPLSCLKPLITNVHYIHSKIQTCHCGLHSLPWSTLDNLSELISDHIPPWPLHFSHMGLFFLFFKYIQLMQSFLFLKHAKAMAIYFSSSTAPKVLIPVFTWLALFQNLGLSFVSLWSPFWPSLITVCNVSFSRHPITLLHFFFHCPYHYLKWFFTFFLVYCLLATLRYNLNDSRNLVCHVHCDIP